MIKVDGSPNPQLMTEYSFNKIQQKKVEGDNQKVSSNKDSENPFAFAFAVMMDYVAVLQIMSNSKFNQIQTNADRARNTQGMANEMDEVAAKAAKGDDKTREQVPDDVVEYMLKNGISVDGVNIKDYIAQHGGAEGLDKGSLQAIKAALDNSVSRDTDLVTQGQLILQKLTQQLSAGLQFLSNLVDAWMTLLKSFAQKISQ